MTKVVGLNGQPLGPVINPELVQMLRECLAAAEQGKVLQCLVVFRQDDGEVDYCFSNSGKLSLEAIIGATCVAQADLCNRIVFAEQPFQ